MRAERTSTRTRIVGLVSVAALAVLPACRSFGGAGSDPAVGAGSAPFGLGKIGHVVVLMQENRSYDHYFGQLFRHGQSKSSPTPPIGNPDPRDPLDAQARIRPFHQTALCEVEDLSHSWTNSHLEWDGGRMDGFTQANVGPADPSGSRALGQYDNTDLNYYYALANTFGIGDRYFASLLGPTYPNRYYLLAGTSFGHTNNQFPTADGWTQKTIFELLDAAHVSWKVYYAQVPFAALFKYVRDRPEHLAPISQYYADAAAGTLPQVSYVDPTFLGTVNVESDEHPPANVQVGQQFTAGVIDALMQSPNWPSSAFFLTYDEHGGYYDHVPPPPAPVPDAIAPDSNDPPAAFDRYGVRVPAIVVSPWARSHYVSHTIHDHTSILRFIETRFGLPALTNRDARANPMLEFFDFTHPTFAAPPRLPAPVVDPVRAAQCNALHGSTSSAGL